MEEPSRIGLTAVTGAQLDELLEHLNPEQGEDGVKLIKYDLYRLAVALGVKKAVEPPLLNDKSISSFRVLELDEDGILFTALDNSGLVPEGTLVYDYIERLAEQGIKSFYHAYQKTGQLPLEECFDMNDVLT